MTDEKYAQRARDILVGYAQRYMAYPYHSANMGKKTDQPGRAGGHVYEQTLDESGWMRIEHPENGFYSPVEGTRLPVPAAGRPHVGLGALRADGVPGIGRRGGGAQKRAQGGGRARHIARQRAGGAVRGGDDVRAFRWVPRAFRQAEVYAYDPEGRPRKAEGVASSTKLLCLRREKGGAFQTLAEAK